MITCTACGQPNPLQVCNLCRVVRLRVVSSHHGLCPCSRGKCRPYPRPSGRVACGRCMGRVTEKKYQIVTEQQARSRAFHQQQGTGKC